MANKHPRRSAAREADPHALYEIAVQRPELLIDFLEQLYAQKHGDRSPTVLREDFCGTAHLAATWVRSAADRRAVAVDLDPVILDHARAHSLRPLGAAARRLRLVESDVRACRASADVWVSLNFSHNAFHDRPAMLGYLRHVRRALKPGGMLVMDLYGGPGAMVPGADCRPFGDFEYVWEQVSYDPVTARAINHIHFRFPDGSQLKKAFVYDWRLWTIPEMCDLFEEAGLAAEGVCFESEEGWIGEANLEAADAWVAYLVAGRP